MRLFDRGAEEYWSSVDPEPFELPHAEFFLTATELLHEAGVPLIAGTDAGGFGIIPGASLARELELLVEAGLLPYAALAVAAWLSAEVLGFERSGVVTQGYKANLVLLQNDPLINVGTVEFPAGVADETGVLKSQAEIFLENPTPVSEGEERNDLLLLSSALTMSEITRWLEDYLRQNRSVGLGQLKTFADPRFLRFRKLFNP